MNITGPAPIASVQQPDENGILLRLNQRLTAEVLQVSGDRVVLAVNGVQLVARMTSMDQSAELVERRQAQFIVKDLSSSNIVLQLVPKGTETSQSNQAYLFELAPQLLNNAGLPVNQTTLPIARALLQVGLQVIPELVNEMETVLSQVNNWGQSEADLAALLWATGLPVSAEALDLMTGSWPSLAELISHLTNELNKLQKASFPPPVTELVEQSLTLLGKMTIDLNADPTNLVERLRVAVQILGSSIERQLLETIQGESPSSKLIMGSENLATILLLRQSLEVSGLKYLIREIDNFLDAIRQMQYLNGEPEVKPVKEQWLKIELPVSLNDSSYSKSGEEKSNLFNAHIQIAYLPDGQREIDSHHTRCVIRVELTIKDVVQVDTTIADRRIGIRVATSTNELLEKAEAELPGLETALEALGYRVQSSDCRIESFSEKTGGDHQSSWRRFFKVQVEV